VRKKFPLRKLSINFILRANSQGLTSAQSGHKNLSFSTQKFVSSISSLCELIRKRDYRYISGLSGSLTGGLSGKERLPLRKMVLLLSPFHRK